MIDWLMGQLGVTAYIERKMAEGEKRATEAIEERINDAIAEVEEAIEERINDAVAEVEEVVEGFEDTAKMAGDQLIKNTVQLAEHEKRIEAVERRLRLTGGSVLNRPEP